MLKHRLKTTLRWLWAQALYRTGLWRVTNALMPRRLLVLAGHCIEDPAVNADLPADMKLSEASATALLGALTRRFQPVTVAEGWENLQSAAAGRSMVALSMDDGYRDNLTALPRVLERTGARCTVYLESRALLDRVPNWSHSLFWLVTAGGLTPATVAREYLRRAEDPKVHLELESLLAEDRATLYEVKRVLKYRADRAQRDRVLAELMDQTGGDVRALCDRIHLTLEEARELAALGVELGGHTVTHEVLSTLGTEGQDAEIAGGRRALREALPGAPLSTFAYPFGRRWDFDAGAEAHVVNAGYRVAVTTHAGVVTRGATVTRLPRLMVDETTSIADAVVQAAGGFLLLERLGLSLLE